MKHIQEDPLAHVDYIKQRAKVTAAIQRAERQRESLKRKLEDEIAQVGPGTDNTSKRAAWDRIEEEYERQFKVVEDEQSNHISEAQEAMRRIAIPYLQARKSSEEVDVSPQPSQPTTQQQATATTPEPVGQTHYEMEFLDFIAAGISPSDVLKWPARFPEFIGFPGYESDTEDFEPPT